VEWQSYAQEGSGWGIYAQRYKSERCQGGSNFGLTRTTTNQHDFPSVAMEAGGNFVVDLGEPPQRPKRSTAATALRPAHRGYNAAGVDQMGGVPRSMKLPMDINLNPAVAIDRKDES